MAQAQAREPAATPKTLAPAHHALVRWLETQAKEDVLETNVWIGERRSLIKSIPGKGIRSYLVLDGKSSRHWKPYLPLKSWTVSKYFLEGKAYRFEVDLEKPMATKLIVDVSEREGVFQVTGVSCAWW